MLKLFIEDNASEKLKDWKLSLKTQYLYSPRLTHTRIYNTCNLQEKILEESYTDSMDFPAKIYLPVLDIIENQRKENQRFRDKEYFVEEITWPNYIVQHIPNFADGFEPQYGTFNTTEELLNIDWVDKYRTNRKDSFHRFSVSSSEINDINNKLAGKQYHLMIEENGGKKWWVIGYLKHLEGLDLPEWEPVYD